ncbi:hypothetical protein CK203_053394 [Vitis vinifera]|uniref:Integrase catalytic domain-containing protein n=1 Tax=Vitis vinifera TaxID=29760 RepID=A0A438GZY7_VITVI|nr:hypothetical protein CK203_053394 [Vitis vinifera]
MDYHGTMIFISFCHVALTLESAIVKDKRALRQLATRFVICGESLYRRSPDGLLLLYLDRASVDRVMREVHAGVCGPHMEGHMLARKIMRTVWGIDIIGNISPKSFSGHEYILVAIDYFTKWVEAASYARLMAAKVTKFIRSHIICRYGVPHELISDRGVHFRGEVDTLVQEYGIQHHRSSAIGQRSSLSVYGLIALLFVPLPSYALLLGVWGLISDLRGKFRPSWSWSYVIRDLTQEGTV